MVLKRTTRAVFFFALVLGTLAKRFTHAAIIDLSGNLPVATNHNANPGASALRDAAVKDDILGYAVVKGGELVASAGPTWEENVWSVTKTWVATLIGIMMQKGIIAPTTTLETALPSVDWNAVASSEKKKAITIAQIMSMSSGLKASCGYYGAQDTVESVLNSPTFADGEVGSFNYLCSGSILSYVIYQQTGKTPLTYTREELFPALGMNDEIVWSPTHGSNDIQESGHGLVLGPHDLAKLGQLYLQGGLTGGSESTELISADFVNASSSNQLISPMSIYQCCVCKFFKSDDAGYGYMQWLHKTASGPANCALGHQGQFICNWPGLDLAIAITSNEFTGYDSSCRLLGLVATGLDFESLTALIPSFTATLTGLFGLLCASVVALVLV
jgi:CubicO group peptidase (beta-lactamase class C family)